MVLATLALVLLPVRRVLLPRLPRATRGPPPRAAPCPTCAWMVWLLRPEPAVSLYGPIGRLGGEFGFYVSRAGFVSVDREPAAGWGDRAGSGGGSRPTSCRGRRCRGRCSSARPRLDMDLK